MRRSAVAGRTVADLAAVGLGVADEVRHRPDRRGVGDDHDAWLVTQQRHGLEVADGIVADGSVQRHIHRVRECGHQHGVAIRDGARHRFGADVAAGARPVLHNGLLPPYFRQPGGKHAAADIRGHTRRERHHKAYEARRPGLRKCGTGDECGGNSRDGGKGGKVSPRDHGRSPSCVVLRGELANSRKVISPILRPISLPSASALRKWIPPQTRALSTSFVNSENLRKVRVTPKGPGAVTLTSTSSLPKKPRRTASAAPENIAWAEGYSGCGGVTRSGSQPMSPLSAAIFRSVAERMAVIGR